VLWLYEVGRVQVVPAKKLAVFSAPADRVVALRVSASIFRLNSITTT
jgi:hypothetical protein